MPSSKLHRNFNILFLFPLLLGLAYYYLNINWHLMLICGLSFLYATLFAHPDLDLANQIKLFSINGLFTLPFRLFYAPFIPHRSKISHSLLWGTPSRIIAVILFALLVTFIWICCSKILSTGLHINDLSMIGNELLGICQVAAKHLWEVAKDHQTEILASIIGFYLADFGHLILDKLN